jgi:hypothetical protein
MNGPDRVDRETKGSLIGRKAREGCGEVVLDAVGRYIGAVAGESAGRRGTADIEPNASNKANVMELMTGCVPLTLVTRARTVSPPAFGFSF